MHIYVIWIVLKPKIVGVSDRVQRWFPAKGFYLHVEIIVPFWLLDKSPISLFCSQQFGL